MDPRLAMMFPAGGADQGLAGAAALPPGMIGSNVGAMSLFGLGIDPGIANVMQFLAPTEQRYQTATLLMQMLGSGNYGPTTTSLPILYASGFEGVPFLGSGSTGILSSLVSMFGAPTVQAVARQHRLIPMGMGHDLNIYDFMLRSQASADRLEKLLTAQRLDVVGYMEAVRGLANLAGVPFGLEQQLAVRNLITTVQPYLPMLSMLAPDLVDQLSGRRGSISSLGLKLIGAGRYRIDPITGRLGISPETAATYIESIFDELLSDPTLRRSKGLSAGQLGALFEQLQLRGMLPSIVSSSYENQTPYKKFERVLNELAPIHQADILSRIHRMGLERNIKKFDEIDYRYDYYAMNTDDMKKYIRNIKEILKTLREDVLESLIDLPEINTALTRLDAKAIIRKLEGYAGAVNAMKEVFAEAGFKNVPIEVAMRGIEVFTLGQAQKYTPEQIANLIRSSRNTANLTGTTIDNFILMQNHAAAVLRQANVSTTLANPITQQALLHTANARGLGVLSVPSVYTPTDQELTQSVINTAAYFAASPIAKIGAVALRLKEMGLVPEDEKNELTRFVKEIEQGGTISEEFLSKGESGLISMMQRNIRNPQANAGTVSRLLSDQKGNAPFIQRLLPLSYQTQRKEILNTMTMSLMREAQLNAIVNQQIENEIKSGALQGGTAREAERRNQLLQVLSRRISESLLDEMSIHDFADERKRQEVIRQVIANTLNVEPSKIDNTLVAGLLGSAIPNFDRIINNMSSGSLPDLYRARAVVGKPAIYGALALQAVRDTRTEIQERLQHLGSSDSIIANIVTTLQAAKPTNRLTLTSLLINSIGTQSIDEIVDSMLPVVSELTKNLKELEDMEKKINAPEFKSMSEQERSNLLRRYESLKQGILQSINEIDTVSKRYGLDAPMRRAPSVRDTEVRFLQSAVDQLAVTNLGYSFIDLGLAARIANSKYSELGQYMPLSYIANQNELDKNRPAPPLTIGGFQQFAINKLKFFMRRDEFNPEKLVGERSKFVDAGLGSVLGLISDPAKPMRYDINTVGRNIDALRRKISVISGQGLPEGGEEQEKMINKIKNAVFAVRGLFGRWMQLNDLAKPGSDAKLTQQIRSDLQNAESRARLMRFLQVVVETAAKANDPNYSLTEQDLLDLLASTIDVGYIIPTDLMETMRGTKADLTVGQALRLLTPEFPATTGPDTENEQIFNWYKYKTRDGKEIKPFITDNDLKGKNLKQDEVYKANRFLASLYLDSSLNNKLPEIETIKEDPRFKALPKDLQEIFINKYQNIYKLDHNSRAQMLSDFGRKAPFVRAARNRAEENLITLANYSRLSSGQYRFDPTELKNRLISEGILSREELEPGDDPDKQQQVTNLLFTIHKLNQIGFETFRYMKNNAEKIKSENKKDKLDAATLNTHLRDKVLLSFTKLMQPRNAVLADTDSDLIVKSMEDIIREIGGGQAITSMLSTIASDIYNISSQLVGPDGRGNVSFDKEILLAGIMNRLSKYSQIIGKYGGNLEEALRKLDGQERRELLETISYIFSLYSTIKNSELERRIPGMLSVDAGQFLRSPVLGYDLTTKGEFFNRQEFTAAQIQATELALERFIPEETKRIAMGGDVGVAQSFTKLAQYFGLSVGPGVDLEKDLTERQKVALVLMTKGLNADTIRELNEKLPDPTDPFVRKLLKDTDAKEQQKAAREIIEQFISDRATSLGIFNLNKEFVNRVVGATFGGGGAASMDALLFNIPFNLAADMGSERGRSAVQHLPRMSADQATRAFEYSYYQNVLAPHIRPILQELFKNRGIDLKDQEVLDIVYQMFAEKENAQLLNKQQAATSAATTPFGVGGMLHRQAEVSRRMISLQRELGQRNLKPEQIEQIARIVKDTNLSEVLRNKTVRMNPSEALQKLADQEIIGTKTSPAFQNTVSNIKAEHIPRIQALITERNDLIKDFSRALQRSMGMTEQQFEKFKIDKGITGQMHPHEQLRRLLDIAKEVDPTKIDNTVREQMGKAHNYLQRVSSLLTELSPIGGRRPSPPDGASSQGGQQGPGGGRLLPSALPGQGPANQLGQNTASPQQPVAAAEPRNMNIQGTLVIEGLGIPLFGRLTGKGQSSVPPRHPVSS